jgi:hypothetical protein
LVRPVTVTLVAVDAGRLKVVQEPPLLLLYWTV